MHSNVNPRWVGFTGNRRIIIDSVSLARSVAAEENIGTTDGMRSHKRMASDAAETRVGEPVSCLLLPPMREAVGNYIM